ncbi:hypothetical protein [Aurantimonas coralicida]|uniref:hypothetical protein n=1 Tax=Aurantimonas coralicida TaxID=182270 RepID=UPI00040FFEE2|nr:hypothetical protein [Aurantimonas coralicida]
MTNPYPLPRETRETSTIVGDGRSNYGPLNFPIWDVLDVVAFVSRADGDFTFEAVTAEKVSGQPFDYFTVTFAPALENGDLAYVQAKRVHERSTDVIRGGALSGAGLEAELSKQATVLQELRRDIDRAIALGPGQSAPLPMGPLEAGRILTVNADGTGVVYGLSELELLALEAAVEAARDAALLANGSGARFIFSTLTADEDPGDGRIRLSNVQQDAALVLRADTLDADGVDISETLASFGASTSALKGNLRLYSTSDPRQRLNFDVTAVIDEGGYFNLTISNTAASDESPFAEGDMILLAFSAAGDKGEQGLPGDGRSYDTVAAAEAENLPALATWIQTAGYTEPGDGGGELYVKTGNDGADVPAHNGYLLDLGGRHFAVTSRTVNLAWFGYDQTDTSGVANTAAFLNAIAYLRAKGGGKIMVPGDPFWLATSVVDRNLNFDLDIEGKPGNRIKAVTGFTSALFNLYARNVFYQTATPVAQSLDDLWFNAAVTDTALGTGHRWNGSSWVADPSLTGAAIYADATLRTDNLHVDCSRGTDSGGGQLASAFVSAYFRNWFMNECDGYGGELATNPNADSFASPIACFNFSAEENKVRGFSDVAYYVGGDNKIGGASGDGGTANILGGIVERCQGVVQTKRELTSCLVKGLTAINCVSGCLSLEVGPGLAGVGRRLNVETSIFINMQSRVFELKAGAKGSFLGNFVQNFALDLVNGGAVANTHAVVLSGASGAKVKGNTFDRGGVPLADQRGALISNLTLDGVDYTGGRHAFEGNDYRNFGRAVVEAAGVDASTYQDEILDNLGATPYVLAHPGSVARYFIVGDPLERTLRDGVTSREALRGQANKTANHNISANENGMHFTNAGQGSQTTFILPPAEAGLRYTFTNMVATSGIRVLAQAGDVPRMGAQVGTTNRQAISTDVGASITFEAVDSTNWIAVTAAAPGNWTLN